MRASLPSKDRDDLHALKAALASPEPATLSKILAIWRTHDPGSRPLDLPFYRQLSDFFLKHGEPLIGYDVAEAGLSLGKNRNDPYLRQRCALALARLGAPERAREILLALEKAGNADGETLGLLGRIYKDLWERKKGTAAGNRHLKAAAAAYARAYRSTRDGYPGINAATLSLLSGNDALAQQLAREVKTLCASKLKTARNEYWLLATLGEANLVLGRREDAAKWYEKAFENGRGNWADIQSTRHQARLILNHRGESSGWIDRLLPVPKVVMFVGHMIDRPNRPAPRFPPAAETQVRRAIMKSLTEMSTRGEHGEGFCYGYASCACGADILFHEALKELGGESHVVLPCEKKAFIKNSVAFVAPNPNRPRWSRRCEQILGQAAEVVTASDQQLASGSESYEYANLILHGLAKMKAAQLNTELFGLAVWDGNPVDDAGGTADNVKRWEQAGVSLNLIDITKLRPGAPRAPIRKRREPQITGKTSAPPVGTHIRGLLFADVVNFSKLTEKQMPIFTSAFLGCIAELANGSANAPVMKNTWGDAVFFVFENVEKTGRFALALRDRINATDWTKKGLPGTLRLRISVHAGPVYSAADPITGHANYFGAHVTRAARIEPRTPPGEIYTSQEFAALAAAEDASGFVCDYVGQIALPKDLRRFPLYHLRGT